MDEVFFELLPGVSPLRFKEVKFTGDVTLDFLGFIDAGTMSFHTFMN